MNAMGGHIRKLRRKAAMTQQTLAERLNVTRQAVSHWENGNTQPDLDTLAAIADVFGVDMMEVIYGEKRMETSGTDPERRKRYLTGLIVFGALALLVPILTLVFEPYLMERFYNDFKMEPLLNFRYYVKPLLFLFLPMGVLCLFFYDLGHSNSFSLDQMDFSGYYHDIYHFLLYGGNSVFARWRGSNIMVASFFYFYY